MARNNFQNQNTSDIFQSVSFVSSTESTSNGHIYTEEQDATGFGIDALFGGNNNDIPQISLDVTFQNSPFYIVEHEIIKPTILTMNGNPLQFCLSSDHIESFNRFSRFEGSEFKLKFQIRIGKIPVDGSSLITDYFPSGLNISYGSSVYPYHLYHSMPLTPGVSQPINCTEFLIHENIVKDLIYARWDLDQNHYVLTLNLVREVTVATLIEQLKIKGDKSSNINLENTKNIIINMMADDDVVLVSGKSAYCFGLFCPLSKKRMEIPIRSKHCEHIQCFDANTFLLVNERTPKWKCPICNISCPYNDLEIQYYFFEILSSSTLSDDCSYIELKSDGTWAACENNEMEKEHMSLDDDECFINELE